MPASRRSEAEIAQLVKALASLPATSACCVPFPVSALVARGNLMALMPETGSRSPKAMLPCRLPRAIADSGQFRGSAPSRRAEAGFRKALYMAAVTAIRRAPRFKAIYAAMITAGKAPSSRSFAIARKLVVIANAILRDKQPPSEPDSTTRCRVKPGMNGGGMDAYRMAHARPDVSATALPASVAIRTTLQLREPWLSCPRNVAWSANRRRPVVADRMQDQ